MRNNLYDVFQLFDATDATVSKGDRSTTTVATQALFFMNSELVVACTSELAKRLLATEPSDTARIEELYRTAYGRLPTAKDSERIVKSIAVFEPIAIAEPDSELRRVKAWSLVCQAIMSANEFLYLN